MTYFPVKTEIQGLLLEKASQPGGQRDGDYQALSHGANFLCVQPSRQQPQDGQSWAADSPESPSRCARLQGSAGADACVPARCTRRDLCESGFGADRQCLCLLAVCFSFPCSHQVFVELTHLLALLPWASWGPPGLKGRRCFGNHVGSPTMRACPRFPQQMEISQVHRLLIESGGHRLKGRNVTGRRDFTHLLNRYLWTGTCREPSRAPCRSLAVLL